MDFSNLSVLEKDNILLKKISESDRKFIESMFTDKDVRKYYIVPKEDQHDYKKIVSYWLHDISRGAGYAWIIYQKGRGLFSFDRPCGFISFEFRKSLTNVRISYALKPEYRKKGFVSKSIELIISKLNSFGVESIEADIDIENKESQKLVEKLGFTTNKGITLIDPNYINDNGIRFRNLWCKELIDYSDSCFFVINQHNFDRLINSKTIFKIWEEEVSDDLDLLSLSFAFQNETTGRYHFSFTTNVTENMVGISNDETVYNIIWELKREESFKGNEFLVFSGWGDPFTTSIFEGLPQFENYEIGIKKALFINILSNLMSKNPNLYSISKMSNVIGLEGFKFEKGLIKILNI